MSEQVDASLGFKREIRSANIRIVLPEPAAREEDYISSRKLLFQGGKDLTNICPSTIVLLLCLDGSPEIASMAL